MKPRKFATIGEAIYSNIDDNQYLQELYEKILFNYSSQLLGGPTSRKEVLKKEDALRFADVLSKSYGCENSESHRAWAQEIVALLNSLYPNDAKVKAYATSILASIGNYRGLELISTRYKSTSFLDELYSKFDLEYLQIPFQDDKYFFHPQKEIYDHLEDPAFSYSGPTSLGKSLIMRMFIKDKIINDFKGNFAILVPTKALISEISTTIIKTDLKELLEIKNYKVVTSGNSLFLKDANHNFIMIMTPERLLYTLISYQNITIDYLFIDEAHKISEFEGRATFYFKVTDMLLQRNKDTHLILASPNIPNPDVFLKILPDEIKFKPQVIRTTFSPVSQMKYVLDMKEHKFLVFNQHKKGLDPFREIMPLNPSDTVHDLIRKLIQKDLTKSTLVYCSGKSKAVMSAIEYASHSSVCDLHDPALEKLANEIESDIHIDYYLASLIRKGIAYHVGYLPLHVRTKIEELYRDKKIKVVFCTSTIIEGVNLPADNLIAISCNMGASGTMTAVEFKNMLGRVGRIKYNLYGNVFIIRQEGITSMNVIKELLTKGVEPQNVAITDRLTPEHKNQIICTLLEGKKFLPQLPGQDDEEYNLLRKTYLILLRDILKDRKSVVREQFNDLLDSEKISIIKRYYEDTTIKRTKPDDDINVSPDQTENLVQAIQNGLEYPPLNAKGQIEYGVLTQFLWKLHSIFNWSNYEKGTLGLGKKIEYYAVILTNWMNGHGLNRLLQDTLEYNASNHCQISYNKREKRAIYYNGSQEHKNIVIGNTLEIIEHVILFSLANYFLRFSTEYKKIKTNGLSFENDWYEYVEYGSVNALTIFLQRNGFSRDTADFIRRNQTKYIIKQNGHVKLKKSILFCNKQSVVDEIKDIAFNIPELFASE